MDWQDWLIWRKGAGKRPKVGLGDPTPTTLRHESALWKATMQRLYGPDWRALLEEQQAAEAEELRFTRKSDSSSALVIW